MADIALMKIAGGYLAPADEATKEVVSKWRLGEGVRAKVSRMRNVDHHRKFFALVAIVAEYSDVFDTTEKALVGVKVACGHCDFLPDPRTGELVAVPKSISFASMDQDEFNGFYDKAVSGVLKHLLPTMTRRAIDKAVNAVMGFA